ncbi:MULTISPECIES: glycosyltransferase family 4 protein [unclassified Bradyrhizobium]|uniref:glycosyltransferase family 4 protein n=1 Tax=unclassified Bradyrhizobium TaxID=2631580 RepID=UPI0024794F7F|nr:MULTISPECIES: glycosyltransferase family 4 protein [unclassified Bradyrhizobium]WGR69667.1 glycosyltransferase family 4 protein [Bradyrhizobium sp. ISRA426]WGR81724.1 glycosyltransferase family 4 protein [Bradyrhizobium sp. ISRA430]WGR84908.1 glycosyltransferase family 4 protein [Bradyrhizobium sp. ISRA432]
MSRREIYMFGFRGFPQVQGGIETHAENLAPRVVELGRRVTVCMRSPYVQPSTVKTWKGVRILRLWTVPNKYFETLLHSVICAIVAAVRRPGVVHIHGIGPAIVTPLLRAIGLRVVVTHHGEDYNREKWGWAARMVLRIGEAMGMRYANKRIAVSRSIGDLIGSKYGKPCEVIPNGVVFADIPQQSEKAVELGLEPGRYVLTVGRLVPEKRQLDLLRAFTAAALPGWKLAIVGRIDHQNEYADRLVREAAGHRNVVMTGFQTGDALRQLYAHAALFVLPSSHEGLPIVLLEALSYGLPVLVSDIAPNLEVVSDPEHIFRVGNCEEMSTKLSALTVARYAEDREAVRRESALRYDWSDIARRTLKVYDDLLGRTRPQGNIARSGGASRSVQQLGFAKPVAGRYGLPRSVNDSLTKPLAGAPPAEVKLK